MGVLAKGWVVDTDKVLIYGWDGMRWWSVTVRLGFLLAVGTDRWIAGSLGPLKVVDRS